MTLSNQQSIQEDEYQVAYHWLPTDDWLFQPETYAFYLSMLPPIEGLAVLDIGCGDGRFTYELRRAGAHVTGLDYSQAAIEAARSIVRGVEFRVGDASDLPFEDASFDVACMIEMLEHLPPATVPLAAKEAARVLRPEGVLLVTVPSTRLSVLCKHYQHFSLKSLKECFAGCFDLQSVRFRNGRWRWEMLRRCCDNRLFAVKPLARLFHRKHLNPRKESDALQIVSTWEAHGRGLPYVGRRRRSDGRPLDAGPTGAALCGQDGLDSPSYARKRDENSG